MNILRFIYRFLGILWVMLGIVIMLIVLGYFILAQQVSNFFITQLPGVVQLMGPLLQARLTFQQLAGLIFGLFCIFFGLGLLRLRPWARTVGIAFHITMGVCVAALVVTFYVLLSTLTASESAQALVLVLGGIVALGLAGIGFQMSLPSAMDAFFGRLAPLPRTVPIKCPTCGNPLDLDKARCPKCDAEAEAPSGPVRAKLVDAVSKQEYMVSTRRQTRIGRDTAGFEINLTDLSVSGEHAMIEFVDGHFHLHALRDTNGTYVNDTAHKIRDAEIRNGDLIIFGRAQFRFITE
jgi:hypothetical protein